MEGADHKNNVHLYLLLAVSLAVHISLFYFFGIRDQFVDSQRYIEMADFVLSYGTLEFSYQIFYAVPILLLATIKVLFPDGLAGFVLFQSLLSTLAAFFLYQAADKLFRNSRAGYLAAAIFLLWLDCIQWNTAIMTESLASSLICFTIYHLVVFRGTGKQVLILAVLLILSVMTRPTGVLSLAGVAFFLLSRYREALLQRPPLGVGVLIFLSLSFLAGAYVMLNEWDFTDQYIRGNIITYMDVIEGQPHYHNSLRFDTTDIVLPDPSESPVEKIIFFIVKNPLEFGSAAVLKVFYLLSFYRPYFSTLHNLYTVAWLTLIYSLFYFGLKSVPDKSIRSYCLAVIIANCLLVAISAVDWDNRFYLPMQPAIVLLAGGGGSYLLKRMGTTAAQGTPPLKPSP